MNDTGWLLVSSSKGENLVLFTAGFAIFLRGGAHAIFWFLGALPFHSSKAHVIHLRLPCNSGDPWRKTHKRPFPLLNYLEDTHSDCPWFPFPSSHLRQVAIITQQILNVPWCYITGMYPLYIQYFYILPRHTPNLVSRKGAKMINGETTASPQFILGCHNLIENLLAKMVTAREGRKNALHQQKADHVGSFRWYTQSIQRETSNTTEGRVMCQLHLGV